jgi:hypothetical protein
MAKVVTFQNGSLATNLIKIASTVIPKLKTTITVGFSGDKLLLNGWLLRINPRRPSYCLRVYIRGVPRLSIGLSGYLTSVVIPDDAEVEIVKPPCEEFRLTSNAESE